MQLRALSTCLALCLGLVGACDKKDETTKTETKTETTKEGTKVETKTETKVDPITDEAKKDDAKIDDSKIEDGKSVTTESKTETKTDDAKTDTKTESKTETKTDTKTTKDTKTDDKSGDALAKGKELYGTKCKSCHGATGNADTKIGKENDIPSWIEPGWKAKWPEAKVVDIVTNGKSGTKMKAFKDKLKEDEILAVSKYARSLGK